MATLYEELFEGKHPRKCEDCMHCDVCDEYADVVEKNPDDCDLYEEKGRTLYDEISERKNYEMGNNFSHYLRVWIVV